MNHSDMGRRIFGGTSSKQLANKVSKILSDGNTDAITVDRFSDGEIRVEIKRNVRGTRAFIIQSTCAPANDTLMELLLVADALRRSSVDKITAVIPYFGYARQDRRHGYSRVPISARLVADMIEAAGVNHVITVDLHATQIQGFFHIPVDNISASPLIVADIYRNWIHENPIVVSPDAGGVPRARSIANHVAGADLAIIDKRRPKANVAEIMNIIGDVRDKTCIAIDDMVDTAGTLAKGANALMEAGARRVVAYATHGVLSGKAFENIENSKLQELVVTDTIPVRSLTSKIRTLSIDRLLAETIMRIDEGSSLSEILE